MIKQKGFTLIELLVVISIIGLLSTLAVVSLSSARAKARDAKRLSDIKSYQTALELYYNDNNNAYPAAKAADGAGNILPNLSATYMSSPLPVDPTGTGNYEYIYASTASSTYSFTFYVESAVNGWTAGSKHVASSTSSAN